MNESILNSQLAITTGFKEVKKFSPDVHRYELPKRLVAIESLDSSELFLIAAKNWETTYIATEVNDNIYTLLNTSDKHVRSENLRYLHHIRETGLILKSAWIMFSKDHKAPNELSKLLTDIGIINSQKKSERKRNKAAIRIANMNASDDFSQNVSFSANFIRSEPSDFLDNFVNMCMETRSMISSTPKLVTEEDFHILRKDYIRHLMNMYRIAGVYLNDVNVIQIFQHLKQIDRRLGHRRDSEKKLRHDTFIIDSDFVAPIEDFIQVIGNIYG